MAARTLQPTTIALTGAAQVAASGTSASSDTMTISASTAQSSLDFKSLAIVAANASTTASVSLSLAAGANFSEIGQGAATISIGTAATVVIGGQGFEGARFLSATGTLVFTQTGAGPLTWTASQYPRATE